jgi:2-methylcitrate dehydratase PrpD
MSLPFLNTAPGYDEELRNSVFFERGLHATSICGAVGAAVAVAMLQGQDEAGIASAAGIAASMGAGLLEANRTGGTVKRVHCGWAARCGVAAADLARHGLTGTIAEPPEAKARPASGYHAAFSGPYTVAAALLGGGLGVSHEDFTDAAARDPRRLALAALVRCVEDERCSASFPHAFPAVLRVTTRTGEELEARVEVNRGGPGNPLSDEELARKFHDNAVRSLPEERAAELAARTLALPDAQSVEDLTALLTSAGER